MEALKSVPEVQEAPVLHVVAQTTPGRRTVSNAVAYALAASVIGLALFASITPSPLYHSYSELWHFSPLTLTLVYATYLFGVLTSLLLVGRVSDDVGRRPVLLTALALLMLSTVVFAVAASVAWLFVARGLQGLATGAAVSAATAALLDLHPRNDPRAVGLANGVASAGGIGLGALVSSSLVQLGSAPRVLPFVVLFVLFALTFAGAYLMPEPVARRSRFRLTTERPSVPPMVRRPFFLAGLAVVSSWSIAGLYFSLGPGLSAQLFDTTNVIVSVVGIVAVGGSGALSQLLLGRTAPWIGASVGSIGLAGGMVLVVLAAATESSATYLIGSLLSGAGFGIAFLGALRTLVAAIPPGHRAAVLSAFYVVAYLSGSLPAVLAGLVVTDVGLESAFEIFGSVVAAIALVVAVEAWRTRPTRGAALRPAPEPAPTQ
jgi:MFS family permease